jgi:hypothetical protein
MLAETPSEITTWLPIVSNLGFAGLVWYLITMSFPKLLERTDQSILKVIQMSDSRVEYHLKETKEQIKLISDSYHNAAIESKEQLKVIVASHERTITEIKEQVKLTADKHEATVIALSQAHEKHLNLVISHLSKCKHETSTTG